MKLNEMSALRFTQRCKQASTGNGCQSPAERVQSSRYTGAESVLRDRAYREENKPILFSHMLNDTLGLGKRLLDDQNKSFYFMDETTEAYSGKMINSGPIY